MENLDIPVQSSPLFLLVLLIVSIVPFGVVSLHQFLGIFHIDKAGWDQPSARGIRVWIQG